MAKLEQPECSTTDRNKQHVCLLYLKFEVQIMATASATGLGGSKLQPRVFKLQLLFQPLGREMSRTDLLSLKHVLLNLVHTREGKEDSIELNHS